MSLSGIAEEITLDSGETEVANITPVKENLKNVTLELGQINKLHKVQRHIRVFDHKTLYVKEKIGKLTRHILLDLSLINEKPVRIREFNTTALVASLALTLLSVIGIYIQAKGLLNIPALYMYGVVGFLIAASVASFVVTAKSLKDSVVFKTAHGQVPFLFLFNNSPNKSSFQQFLKSLSNNIELARANNSSSKATLMAAIVGEHRRLFEKGFISENQFEQAKKNILSN